MTATQMAALTDLTDHYYPAYRAMAGDDDVISIVPDPALAFRESSIAFSGRWVNLIGTRGTGQGAALEREGLAKIPTALVEILPDLFASLDKIRASDASDYVKSTAEDVAYFCALGLHGFQYEARNAVRKTRVRDIVETNVVAAAKMRALLDMAGIAASSHPYAGQ